MWYNMFIMNKKPKNPKIIECKNMYICPKCRHVIFTDIEMQVGEAECLKCNALYTPVKSNWIKLLWIFQTLMVERKCKQ